LIAELLTNVVASFNAGSLRLENAAGMWATEGLMVAFALFVLWRVLSAVR
jgi:hypothetical protein